MAFVAPKMVMPKVNRALASFTQKNYFFSSNFFIASI